MAKNNGTSGLLSQSLNSNQTADIKKVIAAGIVYLQSIEDYRTSMKEAVSMASEDLGIDKAVLMEVIRTVYKQDYKDKSEKRDEVDAIMALTGFGPEED